VGDAGQILWDSDPAVVNTLSKIVSLLHSRYGDSRQADKHHMELKLRCRRFGESLSASASRHQTLNVARPSHIN